MNNDTYDKLYEKYQALIEENNYLKEKIKELEARSDSVELRELIVSGISKNKTDHQFQKKSFQNAGGCGKKINKYSDKNDKIVLFMSLFKGRKDVYPKRWENKKGRSGYSPVCLNEWKQGLCNKGKIKCSKCPHKLYSPLNDAVVEKHLRGEIVIGIYPMTVDERSYFLAMDFDKDGWEKDISAIRESCNEFGIPVAVERSRSGNGGHVWFFFEDEVSAGLARKLGSSLLTYSMSKRHEISFKSYDRLFPNQDTMPGGGFGNLIALPLQMAARKRDNSLFVDEKFEPYKDQWEFLSEIKKLTEKELLSFISGLSNGDELGILKNEEEDVGKPWLKKHTKLEAHDFPAKIEIVKSGMLYIKKTGLSQKALNIIKRVAAFKNPEFYKLQAMRMPSYKKPRIISCSEDYEGYLALPRGCEEDIKRLIQENKAELLWKDETNPGRKINVEFKGVLRQEQKEARDALIQYDNGVLSATTAFGKTIVGAGLISSVKVNTLVLVHRQQLLSQWVKKLSEFLFIDEALPEEPQKRGRKKKQSLIGRLGGGKDNLNAVVDVAIMQSLNKGGIVKECVNNYGMIIVDECHRIPAYSFEQILKKTKASYVYGLTATPIRKDGHHPIIFYYCGPKRYSVDAKKQAEERPFDHYLIPRFTSFKTGYVQDTEKSNHQASSDRKLSVQEIYSELTDDEVRNQLIIDDILESYEKGRNSLILTGRLAHVDLISRLLKKRIPDVVTITGGMGTKKTSERLKKIASLPVDSPLVLVSTGSFIGEGFDEPRLDTLFLAMPVAWKGTLQQYAGRLHRLFQDKKDVQIYDYVDIHVKMLEKMYAKRLKAYAAIGYKTKVETISDSPTDIIFDKNSFFQVYLTDIGNAQKELVIVSPFVTKRRVMQMIGHFNPVLKRQVKIRIITRPVSDFTESKQANLIKTFAMLKDVGVDLIFRPNIHQKFAVIDQKIIWYGSINLLSFGFSEESIMRLNSSSIAFELSQSVDSLR